MELDNTLKRLGNQELLDQIYRFAYRRCDTSHEAEDLCQEIIVSFLSAVQRTDQIDNFYGFLWTIARRTYADFCEKRSRTSSHFSIENAQLSLAAEENEIEDLLEDLINTQELKRIFAEISFLSQIYRQVMVFYYLDEMSVKDIAKTLGITETTVKQRLFSARKIIRKEVTTMKERNLSLKPIHLAFIGSGNPVGNDPRTKAERLFSQNLIYLCKDRPKTAKELSEELCVPMPYVEEELEIQCGGENGRYGMLRKLENGKYVTNILLADYSEYREASQIYRRHLPEFCAALKEALEHNKDRILSFPYLSQQNDLRFILWSLLSRTVWDFEDKINRRIAEQYFTDVEPAKREYTEVAIAFQKSQSMEIDFYGCDGINAAEVGGCRRVYLSNIYGKRLDAHFHCGHNISLDSKLLITIKSIGGLAVESLTKEEKEVAGKALECGYLRKKGGVLEPNILVIHQKDEQEFYRLSLDLGQGMEQIIDRVAEELSQLIKAHVPDRLIREYQSYTQMIAGIQILSDTIEACIQEEVLAEPANRLGAEGVLMVVDR